MPERQHRRMNTSELEHARSSVVAGDRGPAITVDGAASSGREPAAAARLVATWARHHDQVRAAQRLRWRVFADEMGARLSPPPGTPAGLDVDNFDAHCEHLLVQTAESAGSPSQVVGTYRVLTPVAARMAGGLYSDGEFDLARLDPLRPRIAELGRSCTDPAWRSGGVILMLWAALAEFMVRNGLDITMGCASVSMCDGGHGAANLWQDLRRSHLVPPGLQVQPRLALPVDELRDDRPSEPPPLIKGYLRCGGKVLGAPAWDPDFGTADLPMMLDLADLPAAYRKRFIRA
jgi:putative hemolysin